MLSRLFKGKHRWGSKKKAGTFSRRRGLEYFETLFPPGLVATTIERAESDPVRVVEVGCGEGKLLLDILKRFPTVEAHGINKRPWPAMTGPQSYRETARRYEVFDEADFENIRWPTVKFYDAEELRFEDATVDLVASQIAIPYVERKDRLLEEVWRVLRPGGRALLNVDSRGDGEPDFLSVRSPRFVVRRPTGNISLLTLLEERRASGFDVRVEETEPDPRGGRVRVNVRMEKNRMEPLALGLDLDGTSSFPLRILSPGESSSPTFWGFRSVFREITSGGSDRRP